MIELPWDPEVESPASIAILGGGPVGIEAAIYGRFLGYFVSIFESRRVAHRMLDWNNRPLEVPIRDCTTPLGLAAIKAQNPDSPLPNGMDVWTGKQYAENYLLPLAKTDLLFDDIHFLSPVIDVSRLHTRLEDAITPQERCNDEFRLLVNGRHRGMWTSRADVVIDCRGSHQVCSGIGPGGGKAIGEEVLRDGFLRQSPEDRKFEPRRFIGRHVCLVGTSYRACQFVREYATWHASNPGSRLTWIVPDDRELWSREVDELARLCENDSTGEMQTYELVGIERIQKMDDDGYVLTVMMGDDSTVEFRCDELACFTEGRYQSLSSELNDVPFASSQIESYPFITNEPGFYRLRSAPLSWGGDGTRSNAGTCLPAMFDSIRTLYAVLGGRDDLDLYQVMAENLAAGRV
jgi:hypothetical protein